MGKLLYFQKETGAKKMVTIFNVADYFIKQSKGNEENYMTPLKLQKLCYYAQAWSMVWDNKELFRDDFQAWVHGPANYDLYCKYSGRNNIIIDNCENYNESIFDKEQLETLDAVWNAYGKYTGSYLEQLTHQEKPWKETRGNLLPGEHSTKIIDKRLIKEYYQKEYEKEN